MDMTQQVAGSIIMAEMGLYWVISMLLFVIMDKYAEKKIGGKRMLGYKVLRIPKFFCMIFVTGYTVVLGILAVFTDFSVQASTLTYMGIPYFVTWLYYLVSVLRRVRTETKGRFH